MRAAWKTSRRILILIHKNWGSYFSFTRKFKWISDSPFIIIIKRIFDAYREHESKKYKCKINEHFIVSYNQKRLETIIESQYDSLHFRHTQRKVS